MVSNDIQFVLGLRAVWEGFAIGAAIMLGIIFVQVIWLCLKRGFR